MALKTWVPGLRLIFKSAHKYATRYQPALQGNLTTPQYDCLLAAITAIAACLAALGEPIVTP